MFEIETGSRRGMRGGVPEMMVRCADITLQQHREQQGQKQAASHGARP